MTYCRSGSSGLEEAQVVVRYQPIGPKAGQFRVQQLRGHGHGVVTKQHRVALARPQKRGRPNSNTAPAGLIQSVYEIRR